VPHVRVVIGQRLRQVRTRADLDQASMAAFLGISQAQVSRIEAGKRPIGLDDLVRWLEHASASDIEKAETLAQYERYGADAVTFEDLKSAGWTEHQKRYGDLEKEGAATKVYQNSLIPGLLQTPAYAEYLMREVVCKPHEDIAEAVAARLARQHILVETTAHLHFVITETVLRQPFGGHALMAEQLDRLVNVASLRAVDLAVLPTETRMPAAWGTHFDIHEMPDPDESVVNIELEGREVQEFGADAVRPYLERFDFYRTYALTDAAAVDFVTRIANQHRKAKK